MVYLWKVKTFQVIVVPITASKNVISSPPALSTKNTGSIHNFLGTLVANPYIRQSIIKPPISTATPIATHTLSPMPQHLLLGSRSVADAK